MHHWTIRLLALAAPVLLTGCLWGPGKFQSDLTLRKDNSFVLDYRGEIVMQLPPDEANADAWKPEFARCYKDGRIEPRADISTDMSASKADVRPCTPAELAKAKRDYEMQIAGAAASKRKENEEMAKAFGLPGLDDASNRAFAAKLMKYAGWRSVTYRGKGAFDVDYHFEGSAKQDFLFPALPDNDLVIPFIAIRRRADGSVLVTAPALTGGAGPLAARAGSAAAGKMSGNGPVSRAEGRFTVITDGEVLTNNSEDGAAPNPVGRQVRWDVGAGSTKIPETLIRLQ
ncbi:MAG: hypothetical protein ACJ8D6_06585 [Sphingomicrobium sp.]